MLPDADEDKPEWHRSKQEEMESYYTAIGKTPKEEMKETESHVTPFLGYRNFSLLLRLKLVMLCCIHPFDINLDY